MAEAARTRISVGDSRGRLFAVLLHCLASCMPCLDVSGQVVVSEEAEKCRIRKQLGGAIAEKSMWASDGACVDRWGRSGDMVAWQFVLPHQLSDGWLALRYAYDEKALVSREGPQRSSRQLVVGLDGRSTGSVHVPDTGGWLDFATAYVRLPALPAGPHELVFIAPGEGTTTNLDCFTIGYGDPSKHLSLAMRTSIIARQTSPSIALKMTPLAQVKWQPEEMLADITRTYTWLAERTGWVPARRQIVVHIYEDRLRVGSHANSAGIHLSASNSNWDKGNYVHEMLHVFHEGRFPGWLEHPLIRAFEAFDAIPGIFPIQREPLRTAQQRGRLKRYEQGLKLLNSPELRTDDPHEPLFALRVKYGPSLIPRFYRAMVEAGKRGEIVFGPGQPQTKEVIAMYLSQAAGEDVTPVLRQWTGWEKEK